MKTSAEAITKWLAAITLAVMASACGAASKTTDDAKPTATTGCPCSGSSLCTGPRGGRYCITSGGNKRYTK